MENKSSLSIAGAIIICAGLIISTLILGGKLDTLSIQFNGDGYVGGGYDSGDIIIEAQKDYLSEYEAAKYLNIFEEAFARLFQSGALDGTYVYMKAANFKESKPWVTESATETAKPTVEPTNNSGDGKTPVETSVIEQTRSTEPFQVEIRVFSRAKLDECMQKLIEAGKTITIPN
ncbi:MAG: hypothetical protein LBJ12_08325 [Oscillospiraceae bacterium]|jgi:hypothetical protein|nr:hypothetical protein [Oscillospiraceae bacterium]